VRWPQLIRKLNSLGSKQEHSAALQGVSFIVYTKDRIFCRMQKGQHPAYPITPVVPKEKDKRDTVRKIKETHCMKDKRDTLYER